MERRHTLHTEGNVTLGERRFSAARIANASLVVDAFLNIVLSACERTRTHTHAPHKQCDIHANGENRVLN